LRGETHLALIQGEPGIGKSRLAEELFQWCSRHDGTVARTRCYAAHGQLGLYTGGRLAARRCVADGAGRSYRDRNWRKLAHVLPEILAEGPDIPAPQPLTEAWQRAALLRSVERGFRQSSRTAAVLYRRFAVVRFQYLRVAAFAFSRAIGRDVGPWDRAGGREIGREHPLAGLLRELRQSGKVTELAMVAFGRGRDSGARGASGQTRTRSGLSGRPLSGDARECAVCRGKRARQIGGFAAGL